MHKETIRYEELTRTQAPLEVLCAYDGLEVRGSDARGRRTRIRLAGLAAALAAALFLALAGQGRMANAAFDVWQRISPRDLSATRVEVVVIDPESFAAVDPWPWPRYYLARLVEEIGARGAVAIGLDELFPERDRLSPRPVRRPLSRAARDNRGRGAATALVRQPVPPR